MMGRLPARLWMAVFALGICLLLPRPLLSAQGMAPAKGVLLVAGDGIADPRFQQTVILLVRHDAGGVVGIILNRPTSLPLREALPGAAELQGRDDPLFYGGPVDPTLLLVLLRSEDPPPGSTTVAEDIHLTGLPGILERLDAMPEKGETFRTFLGYAGWTPGQLAREIARGDWQVEPFDETAVFTEDPATLWERMRERAKGIWV